MHAVAGVYQCMLLAYFTLSILTFCAIDLLTINKITFKRDCSAQNYVVVAVVVLFFAFETDFNQLYSMNFSIESKQKCYIGKHRKTLTFLYFIHLIFDPMVKVYFGGCFWLVKVFARTSVK